MRKFTVILLFIFCFGLSNINAQASGEDLEEIYLKGGYKEANKAVNEASAYFGENILLPTRLPAIAFTHTFARFTTNRENPKLEISFLNENSGETHYKIFVTSLKYKQEFRDLQKVTRMKLEDGSKAIYIVKENFSLMIFEKNNFQFTLMMDSIHPKRVTSKDLVQIANSIK